MSYLRREPFDDAQYSLFQAIKDQFGFIPNFYRAQTDRTDIVEAEAQLVNSVLIKEGALSRKQKEYIFLVCSAANLSTYCVTAHCEIVRILGIEGPEPEQIAVDYTVTDLPMNMKALLHFAAKLNKEAAKITADDVEVLRTFGYSDAQVMEAVLIVGLAKFANYVSFGLGTLPDFNNPKVDFTATESLSVSSPL